MKDLWVSADGSWGVNKVKKFDATNWRDNDWDRLDAECDADKLAFAKYITRKRNKQAKKLAESIIRDYQSIPVRTFIIGSDGKIAEDLPSDCDDCGLPRTIDFSNPDTWGKFKP